MADKKNLKDYVDEIEPKIKKAKEQVGQQIKRASDAASPQIKKAKEQVEQQIKKASDAASPQLKKAKEQVDRQIKKASDAATPQIKKAREQVEPAVKKAVSKAADVLTRTELYVQFEGTELRADDIIEKVKADYKNKNSASSSPKTLRIYVKPEEKCAYYVVNQDETGRVDL